MDDNLAQFALVSFTSLLFIVDPVAVVPTYLIITQNETAAEQRRTAWRACVAMTLLLVVFAATGHLLFRAFGITLPAFRTAGGLILWYVASDMLRGERRTQEGREEMLEGQTKRRRDYALGHSNARRTGRDLDDHCFVITGARTCAAGHCLWIDSRYRRGIFARVASW
jgi:threonine/homoserine/homoserine lactone efflux protein